MFVRKTVGGSGYTSGAKTGLIFIAKKFMPKRKTTVTKSLNKKKKPARKQSYESHKIDISGDMCSITIISITFHSITPIQPARN